jgi:hypothetical protein
MTQEIKEIDISDLVLWTENPRDPIDENAKDQDVVDHAIDDKLSKWTLSKLSKEMRGYYDYSELPTVVYHGDKPVVYDGNRRMILAKIKHNLVNVEDAEKLDLPQFPKKIPCNVCSEDIALKNVFRKHGDSGSWSPLDRDIFIHKYLKEPKSVFLKLDENTQLISKNPHLNVGFVKKEIFSTDKLKELGFEFDEDKLNSKHSKKDAEKILSDITKKVYTKEISTRNNRGDVYGVLDKQNRDLIEGNKTKDPKPIDLHFDGSTLTKVQRKTKRSKGKASLFFGGALYLKSGKVSDFYRDVADLSNYYYTNKKTLSSYFPSLIRMSLRLLCEAAADDQKQSMDSYLKDNFSQAKKSLDPDSKTTLSTQNVTANSIIQLLHIGAHNYQAANNMRD